MLKLPHKQRLQEIITNNQHTKKEVLHITEHTNNNHNKIITKTYQKPMNLHLYLPGPSAHPLGCLKGTIFGLLCCYREQNTLHSDYLHFATTLYRHLLARSHRSEDILPIFLQAHRKILAPTSHPTQQPTTPTLALPPTNERRLFLHFKFHPNDIPRSTIRRLYDKHCAPFERKLRIKRPTIAYSRPRNIRDHVSQAKLHEAPGRSSKYHMGEYEKGLDP